MFFLDKMTKAVKTTALVIQNILQHSSYDLRAISAFIESLEDLLFVLRSVRLDRDTQFHGVVAVDGYELVVLQTDDIAPKMCDHIRYADQLARLIRQQNRYRKDTAALDEALLNYSRHGNDIHVTATQNGYDLLAFSGQMLQRRNGKQAGILYDHLMILDHVEEANDEFFILNGDDLKVSATRKDVRAKIGHALLDQNTCNGGSDTCPAVFLS